MGKSSVINLIAGDTIAKVSADVDGCTMASTEYQVLVNSQTFLIYDTVGLEEPQMGVNGYLGAIEKALALLRSLTEHGGVHLLLFCLRGNRMTATAQSNYRLFHEFLCDKKVPIALVFTGLEHEKRMEDWWERNQASLDKFGIKSVGHACVTAVKDDDDEEQNAKYAESRDAILKLLRDCTRDNQPLRMPADNWLYMLLSRMMSLLPKGQQLRKRTLIQTLIKRCGMDPVAAGQLALSLKENDPRVTRR